MTPKLKAYRLEILESWITKAKNADPTLFDTLQHDVPSALRELTVRDLELVTLLMSGAYSAGWGDAKVNSQWRKRNSAKQNQDGIEKYEL